jgi:hypothetical protein
MRATTSRYYPDAFSQQSRQVLAELFPDALIANEHDAYAFGLNAVSDGLHVFIPCGAQQLREDLATVAIGDLGRFERADQGRRQREVLHSEIRPAPIATRRVDSCPTKSQV